MLPCEYSSNASLHHSSRSTRSRDGASWVNRKWRGVNKGPDGLSKKLLLSGTLKGGGREGESRVWGVAEWGGVISQTVGKGSAFSIAECKKEEVGERGEERRGDAGR